MANRRLLAETPLEEMYIQPAAGDSGGALGTALCGYHMVLGKPRAFAMEHASWREEHGPEVIEGFLNQENIPCERFDDNAKLIERVVGRLEDGKVVVWCQGRFEWGPRALGHRSILADPRRHDMKDLVNVKIKFREPFRPFVVLYHGMWHPWHGLPYIYEATRLLEEHPEIVFVVIPREGEPDRKNLLFIGEQPFERLPVYLQMADAWCSGFDTDARGERAFSSTLIQSLALGLPVVTGRIGERARRAAQRRRGAAGGAAGLEGDRRRHSRVRAAARRRAPWARGRAAFAEAHFSLDRLDAALAALLDRARG